MQAIVKTYVYSVVSEVYDRKYSWQARVLRASMGTEPGSIVMAMLGREPSWGPALGPTCDILADGSVMVMLRVNGKGRKIRLGHIQVVRDELRRLADHCRLDDAERIAMFDQLVKWVKKDHRATSGEPMEGATAGARPPEPRSRIIH